MITSEKLVDVENAGNHNNHVENFFMEKVSVR